MVLSQPKQRFQLPDGADAVIGDTEEVTVKDTGGPLLPQEDQGVGQGLEPAGYPALEGLAGLGVVVVHEGDRIFRLPGRQGVIQDGPQVEGAALLCRPEEFEMEGDVEKAHGAHTVFQIALKDVHIAVPVFAHGEKIPLQVPAHGSEPPDEKGVADVLDRIQPDAVQLCRFKVPLAPPQKLLPDLRMGEIHVGTHQVVVIAVFPVHLLGPTAAHELIDGAGFGLLVPVHGGEMLGAPPEGGIPLFPSREFEAGPGQDALVLHQLPAAVIGITFGGPDRFQMVSAHPVVQHHVRQNPDACGMEGIDGGQVFVLGAVFGGNRVLLVEFAQVVEVVDTVAHIVDPGLALIGRGEPDIGDAQVGKICGGLCGPPPVAPVGRQIPLKKLDQGFVFHCNPSFSLFAYSIPKAKHQCKKKSGSRMGA